MMRSFASELSRYKGIGPGFDFLRIALATSILMFHAAMLLGMGWIRDTPLWFAEYALVPMFFALSGFLVAGSAGRLSLGNFLINRGLRIIPALAVDIFVCALVIGPIMTTLPLARYFRDPEFARYFLNISGWIHYTLPGVFKTHLDQSVNNALWTVPFEICCYLGISFLIVTRWIARPRMVIAVTIAVYIAGVVADYTMAGRTGLIPKVLQGFLVLRGAQAATAFLVGVIFFQNKDRIPFGSAPLLASLAVLVVATALLNVESLSHVANRLPILPALTYLTIYLGLTPIPVPKFVHSGDYSYGIYLYHMPFLQVVIAVLPAGLLASRFGWFGLVGLGLPVVALWASLSWHLIEKPILGLRKRFSFVARVRGVASEADISVAPHVSGIAQASRSTMPVAGQKMGG